MKDVPAHLHCPKCGGVATRKFAAMATEEYGMATFYSCGFHVFVKAEKKDGLHPVVIKVNA